MTDYSKNNDLGGHVYTDSEMQQIASIAMLLRERDWTLKNPWNAKPGTMPRPRDYIPMFTKSAGFLFELAKNLAAFPLGPNIPAKSIDDWLAIILKEKFGNSPPTPLAPFELRRHGPGTGFDSSGMLESMRQAEVEASLPGLHHVDIQLTIEPEALKELIVEPVTMQYESIAGPTDPDADVEMPVPDWVVNCDPLRAREILVQLCMHEPGLFVDDLSISGGDLLSTVNELFDHLKNYPEKLDECMTRTVHPTASVDPLMLPSED